jgi:hypothetical protein
MVVIIISSSSIAQQMRNAAADGTMPPEHPCAIAHTRPQSFQSTIDVFCHSTLRALGSVMCCDYIL